MTMNVTIHRANRITIEKPHYLKEVETWERRIIIRTEEGYNEILIFSYEKDIITQEREEGDEQHE